MKLAPHAIDGGMALRRMYQAAIATTAPELHGWLTAPERQHERLVNILSSWDAGYRVRSADTFGAATAPARRAGVLG